jgi:hypothetical protein
VVDGSYGRRPGKTAENWSRNDRIRAGAVSGPWRSAPRTEPEPVPPAAPTPVAVAPAPASIDVAERRAPRAEAALMQPRRGGSRAGMVGWIIFGLLFAAGCVGLAFVFQPVATAPEEPPVASSPAGEPADVAGTTPAPPGEAATAAAATPAPVAISGITDVRLRTGSGFDDATRDEIVALLGKAGLSAVQVEPLPFAVSNSRVGYYTAEDAAAAEALAAYVAPALGYSAPIAVRDYGALLEDAAPGRLDLWIGGE